jgi:hypothetical protein
MRSLTDTHLQSPNYSIKASSTLSLLHQGRRNTIAHDVAARHTYIAPALYPYIFPLYHPRSLDVLLFWGIPSSGRSGHVVISAAVVGAEHGILNAVIQEAQDMKVKRSMYAETHRERASILEAIRASEWNAETNPVSMTIIEPDIINHNFSETSVSIVIHAFGDSPHRASQVVPGPRDIDVEEFLYDPFVQVYSEIGIGSNS